jgi:DUF4097 and DUF4098 domain-containing protein YvlB
LFSKFWPLLLILWGIIKLIEHEQNKRAGIPGSGIGAGGVFLVIFIVIAGLIATGVSRVDWPGIRDHMQIDDSDFNDIFGGRSFDFSGEMTADIPTGANRLEINDDHGSVTVNVSDDKRLRVDWRKKVHAEDQPDADRYNKETGIAIAPAGNSIAVNADVKAGDKGVNTDLDIYVPREMALVITSRRGAITIDGMGGGVQINHQHGDINVSNLVGQAAFTVERSSIHVQHVKGDVSIQGRANEVDVEDIDGTAHLEGEFMESIRFVRISKTVTYHSSRTDMEFARLGGRLDLDSSDLRADSLLGPMRLNTRSKDIALEGLTGDLRLEDENGSVDVALQKPGNIQIDNPKGDVKVSVPPDTPLKVEARTREGNIESDFDAIKVESHGSIDSASGSIGSNGPRLVINCGKGDIEIRKGTAAVSVLAPPEPPAVPEKPGKPAKALPAPKAKPVESEN